MKELTLKVDNVFLNEIDVYLLSLKGIEKVKVDYDNNEIYIKYDDKIITLNILKMEILSYLELLNIPSIISFNMHSKNKLVDYELIINDLCCEYCLKGIIEELLLITGIDFVGSNFDYKNKKNVLIYIKYDSQLITLEQILELEKNIICKINIKYN